MATTSGGVTWEATGTPIDEATALNLDARLREAASAGADSMSDALADAKAYADTLFARTPVRLTTTEHTSFESLTPGLHYVPFASHAKALGLPVEDHGFLLVHHYGPGEAGTTGAAWFFPRTFDGLWRRARNNAAWGAWSNYLPGGLLRTERLVTSASKPLDFTTLDSGFYQVTRTADGQALGLPTSHHGTLHVQRWTTSSGRPGMATWTTRPIPDTPSEVWATSINNDGSAEGWTRLDAGGGQDQSANFGADMMIRHEYLSSRHQARIGGPIDVGDATPVAVVWDDYPADMRDKGVISMARQHKIPITFAVCSRTMDPAFADRLGGHGITWEEVDSWVADGTVEIANHGATHAMTIDSEMLEDEIVTGLAELKAQCPSQDPEAITWVMPSNEWESFHSGRDADAWASRAGQLIVGHHPVVTGLQHITTDLAAPLTVPMTGRPVLGQGRAWMEATDLTRESRERLVTRCYGRGAGVILSAHASWIGREGRWTTEDVEAFFAFLRAEEDAGRIKLMHLSRWAFARAEATT